VDAVHPWVVGETVHPVIDDLLCLVVDSGPGLDRRVAGIEEVPLPFLVVGEVLRSDVPGRGRIHLRQGSSIPVVQLQQKTRYFEGSVKEHNLMTLCICNFG
jgi:hypothetical protein